MLEEKKKSDSYRKNFRVLNRQYSENNNGKSVFEHGRKGGQNFNRTSTKQRPLNLKFKKNKIASGRTNKLFCTVEGLLHQIKKCLK